MINNYNYCNEIKVTATDVPTELRVKRINSSAVLPTRGSKEAAGYDYTL